MNAPSTEFDIGATPPQQQTAALSLVFSNLPAQLRLGQVAASLAAVARGEFSLAGLLEARRDGRLVGAVWGSLMPGRTALVWPAQLVEGEPEQTAGRLHEALEAHLAAADVQLAQALLPPENQRDAQRLIASGFEHSTDLQYMACELEQVSAPPADSSLTFQPYSPEGHAALRAVVAETYRQTQDCPWLNGVREIDDVLDGYRRTGQFDPNRWLLVRYEDCDIGCLLLTDHPQQQQWELVYMGIVPSQRGRRWGLQVTHHARWMARQAGRKHLVLAVDAANTPAITTYTAAGFAHWSRQGVFMKVF